MQVQLVPIFKGEFLGACGRRDSRRFKQRGCFWLADGESPAEAVMQGFALLAESSFDQAEKLLGIDIFKEWRVAVFQHEHLTINFRWRREKPSRYENAERRFAVVLSGDRENGHIARASRDPFGDFLLYKNGGGTKMGRRFGNHTYEIARQVVRDIRDDFVALGQAAEVKLQNVTLYHREALSFSRVERAAFTQVFLEVDGKVVVKFYRRDMCAASEQFASQRTEARADFEHRITGTHTSAFADCFKRYVVVQPVLAQGFFWYGIHYVYGTTRGRRGALYTNTIALFVRRRNVSTGGRASARL